MSDTPRKRVFLSNLHYFYGQTDGSYNIPSSADGDLLKTAKREIEELERELTEVKEELAELREDKALLDLADDLHPQWSFAGLTPERETYDGTLREALRQLRTQQESEASDD